MQQTVYAGSQPPFTWIDVTAPEPEELQALALQHGLHGDAVQDCLEPEHLPKYERIDGHTFLIVRAFDARAGAEADTVQKLTRKVALFYDERLLLTIHRSEQPFLEELKRSLPAELAGRARGAEHVALKVLDAVLSTFWQPLDQAEAAADRFEQDLFVSRQKVALIRDVHLLSRRLSAIRSIARHSQEVVLKLKGASEAIAPRLQDLKEHAEGLYFAAHEQVEDVQNLINLQLSLSAQETNQVMRLLTLFSVFFLPLTFIVGVYGMNFEHMPELKHPAGYWVVWAVMLGVTLGIYGWFRRRDWL